MRSKVSIVDNQNVKEAIFTALASLGDLTMLFKDKHVAIKPNETWASVSDVTACTQADSVEAVIQYVKKFEPYKITVTGGSGAAETAQVFRLIGINKVIKREDVEFFDHNRPPFVEVGLSYGPQEIVMVNPHVFSYDTLISLAQHKVHSDATVTLTMKNIAMSYPAGDYYGHPRSSQAHVHNFFQDIQGFIASMCKRFPIQLGIIVGHPAMIETGPIGGRTFESGLTIASCDFVACDYVGARMLGYKRVDHIQKAESLRLGMAQESHIEFVSLGMKEAIELFNQRKP